MHVIMAPVAIVVEYVVRCAIWYLSYNLKNVKNTHGRVLLLVKLQALACNLLKVTFLHGCFSRFLNCGRGTKLRNAPHVCPIDGGKFEEEKK